MNCKEMYPLHFQHQPSAMLHYLYFQHKQEYKKMRMHCHQGNLKTTISYPPLSSTTAVCLQLSKKHVCLHSSINSRQGYLEFVLGSCDFLVMSKQQNRRAKIFFCKYLALRDLFHLYSRQFKSQLIHILNQSVHFQLQMQLKRYLNR